MVELLEKLRAEFTKSRACHSTDNALIEGKNGDVVRKYMGYGHIAGGHAARIQEFYIVTAALDRRAGPRSIRKWNDSFKIGPAPGP